MGSRLENAGTTCQQHCTVFPSYQPSLVFGGGAFFVFWAGLKVSGLPQASSMWPTLSHWWLHLGLAHGGNGYLNWVSQFGALELRFMAPAWGWNMSTLPRAEFRGHLFLGRTPCYKAKNTAWPTADQHSLSKKGDTLFSIPKEGELPKRGSVQAGGWHFWDGVSE